MDKKRYQGRVFHVISNTHWDREWRFSFQENRQMLVQMIDQVLDILQADPTYRAFHLDSQSIVLDDYLEVRPHKREIIEKFVKAKRLLIGPWYILPDEFLVGGENLIRNLLLGHKVTGQIGRTSKIGYSPFSWGQISQLPQIYRQFGIELIMFYRGVNSLDSHNAEFIWEGADGTRRLSSRFSTMPRYNFYFYIYRPVFHNEKMSDIEFEWSRGGTPFHFAGHPLSEGDYFTAAPREDYFENQIVPSVESIIENQVDDFTTPHVIWMEGHDSSGPNRLTPRLIRDIKKRFPGIDVRHSTLEEYAALVKKTADTGKLPVVKGERRSAQYDRRSGNLYGYVTSARMYLKQTNFEAEKWLQYYAEPMYAFMGMNGMDTNDEYIPLAWNMLIQNSAHDSIGGCSLDAVHDDMMSRYKQIIEIAQGCYTRASMHLARSINTSRLKSKSKSTSGAVFITVLNPTQFERCGTVTADIDIPASRNITAIQLRDGENNIFPAEIVKSEYCEPVMEQLINRPLLLRMNRHTVQFEAQHVPPFGYKTYILEPGVSGKQSRRSITRKSVIKNEFLKIRVNQNGTFTLTDTKNKMEYRNLGLFYDEGEAGHAWVHTPLPPEITSENCEILNVSTYVGTYSSEISYSLTLRIPEDRSAGHEKTNVALLPLNVTLTLTKGSPVLRYSVKVDNTARNHRLRLLFPTAIVSSHHYAEGQFDIVKRSNIRPDTRSWVEQPMYDYPAHHFITQCNTRQGFALFNNGIKEYEILPDRETIALTLLRSFTHVIQPSSREDYSHQPGSQCFGQHEYTIGIYAYGGKNEAGAVFRHALNFTYGMQIFQHGAGDGTLPDKCSFVSLKPEKLIISAMKRAENGKGYIIRIFNPEGTVQDGTLKFFNKIISAAENTLEEKPVQSLPFKGKSVRVRLQPKQIYSLRVNLT